MPRFSKGLTTAAVGFGLLATPGQISDSPQPTPRPAKNEQPAQSDTKPKLKKVELQDLYDPNAAITLVGHAHANLAAITEFRKSIPTLKKEGHEIALELPEKDQDFFNRYKDGKVSDRAVHDYFAKHDWNKVDPNYAKEWTKLIRDAKKDGVPIHCIDQNHPENASQKERTMDSRNATMSGNLKTLAESGHKMAAFVGTAHVGNKMVGKEGTIDSELAKNGYTGSLQTIDIRGGIRAPTGDVSKEMRETFSAEILAKIRKEDQQRFAEDGTNSAQIILHLPQTGIRAEKIEKTMEQLDNQEQPSNRKGKSGNQKRSSIHSAFDLNKTVASAASASLPTPPTPLPGS